MSVLLLAAAAFASSEAEHTALTSMTEGRWQVARVVPFAGGTHVHLRPTVRELRVDGATRVVTLGRDGRIRRSRGARAVAHDVHPRPALDARAAGDLATGWAAFLGEPARQPHSELVVRLDRERRPHLAYAVDLAVARPFSTWRVWVDAHDGEVLGHARTSFDARGNVYPTNPEVSTLTEVELPGLVAGEGLVGDRAYAWSCDDFSGFGSCEAKSSHAFADPEGNYLYAPDATSQDDPLAEVQMYYHLDKVAHWFDTELGFTLPEPIEGLVNFPLENAFYGDADGDGVSEVAFGQGGGIDFAYDGDVIYHEFGHAVIGTVTGLGFFGADAYGLDYTPLSLNEGSADVFSLLLTGDPQLGEYAGAGFGLDAIRDLGPDRSCPEDLYGEGHEDGMIWAATAWNLAEDPLIGKDLTAQIFYGAATSWSSEMVSWADAGQSLVDTADDLLAAGAMDLAAYDAAIAHVEAAGLPGCERVIPLDHGATSTQFVIAAGMATAFGGYLPLTAQLSLEAPEGTQKLKLEIERLETSAPGTQWTVFVRRGAFVEHEVDSALGFDFAVPAVFDFQVDGEGSDTIVIDAESDPPLEAGATYYFAVSTRADGLAPADFGVGEGRFSGEAIAGEDPMPGTTAQTDAVSADTEGAGSGGGCGCATGGSPLTVLLPVGALLVLRRKPPANPIRGRTGSG